MEEMGVIDRFLETFMAYIDSGFGLLAGDVAYLTTTLIVIDITLAGLFWALSQNADVMSGLLKTWSMTCSWFLSVQPAALKSPGVSKGISPPVWPTEYVI